MELEPGDRVHIESEQPIRSIDAKTPEEFDKAAKLESARISNDIYTGEPNQKLCRYLADSILEKELIARYEACNPDVVQEKLAAYKEAALNQDPNDITSMLKAQDLEKAWKNCVEEQAIYRAALNFTDPRKENT